MRVYCVVDKKGYFMAARHLVITYDHDIEHKFMKNNDF